MGDENLRRKINSLVDRVYASRKIQRKFIPSKTKIQYSGPIFDEAEAKAVICTLLDGWLAIGKKNHEFELELAKYLGGVECITVNSGSSSNLLAIQTLMNENLGQPLKPGDEVITTAMTFPTTCNVIFQSHLIPVFVDVQLETYNIDPALVEEAISEKTRALMLFHAFGNPCDMDALMKISKEHGLKVIEDACDSLGSTYDGKKVGTFGEMGTFSFYCAHQITMGEGGAIATNNPHYGPIIRSMRDWGRACVCPICKVTLDPNYSCPLRLKSKVRELEDYDQRYLYLNVGYNLKIIEMQAAFGLEQLKRLDEFNEKRRENFKYLVNALTEYQNYLILPKATRKSNPSWFSIPITIRPDAPFNRKEIVQWLEKHNIETRPLFTGNITKHPAYKNLKCRIIGELKNTDLILNNSFFIGCYPGITPKMREFVVQTFDNFFKKLSPH